MVLHATFQRVIFESDAGFCVYLYYSHTPLPNGKPKGGFTAKGYCLGKTQKVQYEIEGNWTKDNYGESLSVTSMKENISGKDGIIAFLTTLKGMGKLTAAKVYRKFGDDTLKVLDTNIDRLIEVRGISEAKLDRIKESYVEMRGARNLIQFLAPYGVSNRVSVKIYNKYGEQAEETVKTKPFSLMSLFGIGFSICDRIAEIAGISKNDPARIEAGIFSAFVKMESDSGSIGFSSKEVERAVMKVLGNKTDSHAIGQVFRTMLTEKKLYNIKGCFFRAKAYIAECEVATRVAELASSKIKPVKGLSGAVDAWQKDNGITLHPEQRKAVETSLSAGFSVITGGAGRGKTTIAKAICDIRKKATEDDPLLLLSPTGKAAQRLSEATGCPASTIHSALQLTVDSQDDTCAVTVSAATVIVDEASMLDLWVSRELFKAIENGSQVILIGDINQLPSVGAGAILRDIISSGIVPVTELIKTYRQGDGSLIVENADKIKEGDQSIKADGASFKIYNAADTRLKGNDDFERSAALMTWLYKKKVKEYGSDEVVCLSPYHHAESASSVDAMNAVLQGEMNPFGDSIKHRKTLFRVNDLVIQTKNEDGVQNGDVGIVKSVDVVDKSLVVDFGSKKKEYVGDKMDNLELAYALSIHKSQGSEYKCVILNILDGHKVMLKRNLLYTAVTRAKVEVCLVTTPTALRTAISTEDTNVRLTLLSRKIRQAAKTIERDKQDLAMNDALDAEAYFQKKAS